MVVLLVLKSNAPHTIGYTQTDDRGSNMATQSASTTSTTDNAKKSLLKRTGIAAYRVLALMTENAYRGYQAQLAPYYGTI